MSHRSEIESSCRLLGFLASFWSAGVFLGTVLSRLEASSGYHNIEYMSFPNIAGLQLLEVIGSGCVGTVYRAEAADGKGSALKLLNPVAIHKKGLESALVTLQNMPPHAGVLPVLAFNLRENPLYIATPLIGAEVTEVGGGKVWQTSSLEGLCGRLTSDEAWKYVYGVADALGHMHRHAVAHGNITTGNVLLSGEADAATRLSDVALGWVGGSRYVGIRHHYLFLCPDQAEAPDGFFQGYGFSWDVYSFGVVAYRLLTGQYPRGAAAWNQELSNEQMQSAKGLAYSLNGDNVIRAIRSEPHVSWPKQAGSVWEERQRKVIERALEIDSGARWVDMRDVASAFEAIEADHRFDEAKIAADTERGQLGGEISTLNRRWMGLAAGLAGLGVYAGTVQVGLLSAWRQISQSEQKHAVELGDRNARITDLSKGLNELQSAKKGSDANLQRSQSMVDQMLTQLLQLPMGNNLEVSFSREQLTEATDYLKAALGTMEKEPGMGPERARAYGNLGMILLKQRRPLEAQTFLDKARHELHGLLAKDPAGPHSVVQHQWLGRYNVLLASITSARGDGDNAMKLLNEATENLDPALKLKNVSRPIRYEAAEAWFNLGVRKRKESAAGEAAEALKRVAVALGEEELGGPPLDEERFLLARAELERGLALRDSGDMDGAIQTLIHAVEQMSLLVSGSAPKNQDQALVLAEAYTDLADIISRHLTPKEAAEAYEEAGKVLIELIRLEPDWVEAKYLIAKNYGAQAGISRDEGRPSEALSKKKIAVEQIGEVLGNDPDNPRYLFMKAKLKGELAEIMCDLGQAKSAIPIAEDSVKTLEGILQRTTQSRIAAERKDWEIQLAVAYGINGQTLESAKKSGDAKTSFTFAEKQWSRLSQLDKSSGLIQQGLDWARNRLQKLQ